jgi:ABC-type lipoprotein export system ATPase subunit
MNERGTSFLLVTHDLDLAAQAKRQLTMQRGRLLEVDQSTNARRSSGVRQSMSSPRSR